MIGALSLVLNSAGLATGWITKPVAIYQTGKSFFSIPGITGIVTNSFIVNPMEVKEVLNGYIPLQSAIMDANVREDSRFCEHPIESGAIITDHKVFNPVEIDITLVMPSYDIFRITKEMEQLYKNSELLIIKTKHKFYTNMVLQSVPHFEEAKNVYRVPYKLHFKQALIVKPQMTNRESTSNPSDSNTQKIGVTATA